MLQKMFNFRRFLNTETVERYEPLLITLARDMTNDELTEAHKALNRVTSIVTTEQISRDEICLNCRNTLAECNTSGCGQRREQGWRDNESE